MKLHKVNMCVCVCGMCVFSLHSVCLSGTWMKPSSFSILFSRDPSPRALARYVNTVSTPTIAATCTTPLKHTHTHTHTQACRLTHSHRHTLPHKHSHINKCTQTHTHTHTLKKCVSCPAGICDLSQPQTQEYTEMTPIKPLPASS